MQREYLAGRLIVQTGDITTAAVDAVVNAANSSLLGGGGVDGAIHRAGGPAILEACRQIRRSDYPRGLPPGEAVATTAGELPARFVIHTVGPVWGQDRPEADLLASCYRKSLELAESLELRSIAFPAISTGVYGYPKPQAAQVVSQALAGLLPQLRRIEQVWLVFFSPADADVFVRHQQFPSR
ncbi:MAG TPA: O-acetyl-ADP-ribose deacetylase [Povalibacter sp.]|uniref:O-acetyl-ADP-ribose deacetylase n=1 Tax=Povalibacter sp. TaxID=1962978 RepID=UPI002B736E65|nr:O-acetyl-ADP-ribose deacetylase [Povalibacter sp.]HMN45436.1 O-acetyl-ADP-ribose deacetylase [Povalibacter sp.]